MTSTQMSTAFYHNFPYLGPGFRNVSIQEYLIKNKQVIIAFTAILKYYFEQILKNYLPDGPSEMPSRLNV